MNIDFRFYLSRFARRLHYFLVVAVLVTAVGFTLAYILPPVYHARAKLLVESPQIPNELASVTVDAGVGETLQIIQQRILTRPNLLALARDLSVYPPGQEPLPDGIVNDMRRRIEITLPGQRDAAAFVSVSFAASSGSLSALVTNELVSQILAQNVEIRTQSAGQTLSFFQQEVSRLSDELGRQSAKILQFKLANKDALPDSLNYRRSRQSSQQERLLQMQRDHASLQDRRAKLVEIYERTGRVDSLSPPRSPEEKRLNDLRNELSSALIIYSPQNPRVKVLQGQVAALEKAVAAQGGQGQEEGQLSAFDLQLADIDGQIKYLETQIGEVEAELAELGVSIDKTPANAISLDDLQREYDNIQQQYNQAVARLSTAATGDRIEAMSRGRRITVIEQAVVPREPDSPNRPLIAAGGLGGGIALGIAVVILLEFLNRSIQRPVDISSRLNIVPLVTIPYIRTRRETRFRRSVIGAALAGGLVGVPAALVAVHFYVMPIDLLMNRMLDKSGIMELLARVSRG